MRPSELRPLQPFMDAVGGYVDAITAPTPLCRCELGDAGRWQLPAGGCVGERGCRTVRHVVVRSHLAQLRVPVDHVTDPELVDAVRELRALCRRARRLSAEEFAFGVQAALHAERVGAPDRG